MIDKTGSIGKDPFGLSRFIKAQDKIYDRVLHELRSGRKRTHWMWFVFPQIAGLGYSSTTQYYSIKSAEEARQYLKHPVLGERLRECAETILALEGLSVEEIFGYPDDLKLKSSMTLFASAAEPHGRRRAEYSKQVSTVKYSRNTVPPRSMDMSSFCWMHG